LLENPVASACLLFDEQSFSSGSGDAAPEPVAEMKWLQSLYPPAKFHSI
jgi:hypothetical protein